MRIPKTAKGITKRLTTLALKRLALEDQIKSIQAEESALKEAGVGVFLKAETGQVHVEGAGKVTLTTQPIARVEDWKAAFTFASRYPDAGIVHKRVSPTAIEKLAQDGKVVPGVVLDHKRVLNVNVREGRKKS